MYLFLEGMPLTNSSNHGIESYPRRWLVLFISMTNLFLQAFIQSCFCNINNVYAEYFNKTAWQIDWFGIVLGVTWMISMPPMIIIAKKMNVRSTLCFTAALSCVGYSITTAGHLTRNGYSAVVVGQAIGGISGIACWSLLSLVPAVWFPSHQVAIAVAALVVPAGIGKAAGSIIPPYIVSMKSTSQQVKWNLFAMFATLSAISSLMLVMSVLFTSGPLTPPSKAEEKALDLRKREQSASFIELMKNVAISMKILFTSRNFLLLYFSSGASFTTLDANNILLSSMLRKALPASLNIDKNTGVFVAVSYLLSTLGAFIVGPIIAKTSRYKEIVLVGILLMLFSSILLLIGLHKQSLYVIYCAVLVHGFSNGVTVTSLIEILIEITYPENLVFVTMLILVIVSSFRFLYPIVERLLLELVNATAANLLPVVMIFVSFVLILFVTKDYRRSFVNNEQEAEILISSPPNYGTQSREE